MKIKNVFVCIYIYIGTQSKSTKRWKPSSAIKQLLETHFLAIKMCTGFTTDGTCLNTMCAVSLVKNLRAVASATEQLRSQLYKSVQLATAL